MAKPLSNIPGTIQNAIRPKPITHHVQINTNEFQIFTKDGRVEYWIFKSGHWMMKPFASSTKPKKNSRDDL